MDEIEERIKRLYEQMKPLQDQLGIRSKTIEERYQEYLKKKELQKAIPRPKFKLPKL